MLRGRLGPRWLVAPPPPGEQVPGGADDWSLGVLAVKRKNNTFMLCLLSPGTAPSFPISSGDG